MTLIKMLLRQSLDTLKIYWTLVRIVVPVAIATELMAQLGVIEALSPLLAPVMSLYGLPPDLALAWLTGMLIGIWGAVPIVMALGPGAAMSVADMTVFAALLLFAHALPIEQKIIQKTGAGLLVTTLVRVAGGMIYAALLHQLFAVTGWLSAPLNLAWMPARAASGWIGFIESLSTTLISMLVILLGLAWALELLKRSGLLEQLMRALDPLLGLAGIHGEARYFTTIGLFLGISYGGGLLIREARAGASTAPSDSGVLRLHGVCAQHHRGHAHRDGAGGRRRGRSCRSPCLRRGRDRARRVGYSAPSGRNVLCVDVLQDVTRRANLTARAARRRDRGRATAGR